jgi:large subunit ribosomal protein L10
MAREEKAQIIAELQEVLGKCSAGVLTDYRGLSAGEMTELRKKLREAGIEYRVVKNTLARFAAEKAGREDLLGLLEGPVAIAAGFGEITDPSRVLAEYIQSTKSVMSIKGGFLDSRVLTADEVKTLAKLPAKEVLLAQVLGGMQSPIVYLVNTLAAPMRGIMGVLQARIEQLEGN